MGCKQTGGRNLPGGAVEVLVTQTHILRDARTAELARWLAGACKHGGLEAYYEENLSAAASLKPPQRRRLRTAFESAACVLAVAVSGAEESAAEVQLSNEVMWAEQHSKPIVIMYDSSKPFKRSDWEQKWPDLFRCCSVVRYYGKGHEACRDGILAAVRETLGASAAQPSIATLRKPSAAEKRSADEVPDAAHEESTQEAVIEAEVPDAMPLTAALDILRTVQDISMLSLERDAPKSGILRQRAGGSHSEPAPRSRTPFKPTDQKVQHAVKSLVLALNGSDVDWNVALDCLKASVGASEYATSASLRALAAKVSGAQPGLLGTDELADVLDWTLASIRRHDSNADVCTHALNMLSVLVPHAPSGWPSSRDAADITKLLHGFQACRALQQYGFALLARVIEKETNIRTPIDCGDQQAEWAVVVDDAEKTNAEPLFALRGGGLARIFTRLGVSDLAVQALQRHYECESLAVDVCMVLQGLAGASREVKLHLAGNGVWAALLTEAKPDGAAAVAMLRTLAALATDDIDVKNVVCADNAMLEVLERRLFELGNAQHADGQLEPAEAFGLLCRLTARHEQNKQRCLISELPRRAVEYCTDRKFPEESRLAAGGFLVNLCGDEQARQELLLAGATRAAGILRLGSTTLSRCGRLLEQQLRPSEPEKLDASAPPQGSAFDGLFAVRRGHDKKGESSKEETNRPSVPPLNLAVKSQRSAAEERRDATNSQIKNLVEQMDQKSKPGGQRRLPKSFSSKENTDGDDQGRVPKGAADKDDTEGNQADCESAAGSSVADIGDWVPFAGDTPVGNKRERTEGIVARLASSQPRAGEAGSAANASRGDAQAQQPQQARRAQGSGLKGKSNLKEKLAGVRQEAQAAERSAAKPAQKGLFSGFGRQSDSSKQDADALTFLPSDRQREAQLAQLAVAASGAAHTRRPADSEDAPSHRAHMST